MSFFDDERSQSLEGLGSVPRATVGRAKGAHNRDEAVEVISVLLAHGCS